MGLTFRGEMVHPFDDGCDLAEYRGDKAEIEYDARDEELLGRRGRTEPLHPPEPGTGERH